MAQYRQSGFDRFGTRSHDLIHGNHSNGASDYVSLGMRIKTGRTRRSARSEKSRRVSTGAVIVVVLALVLVIVVLGYHYLSGNKDLNSYQQPEDDLKNGLDFLTNVPRTETNKVLKFGQGSVVHGRDSRYWDKDDRRRDEDYNEDVVEQTSLGAREESADKVHLPVKVKNGNKSSLDDSLKGSERKGVGLYNEAGRNELKMYEAEYEASLKNVGQLGKENDNTNQYFNDGDFGTQNEAGAKNDDYDDGIDSQDSRMEEYDDSGTDKEEPSLETDNNEDGRESSDFLDARSKHRNIAEEVLANSEEEDSSLNYRNVDDDNSNSQYANVIDDQSTKKSKSDSKRKAKRHKSGSCEMKFLDSMAQLVEPLESRKFARFSLQYTEIEAKTNGKEQWESRFAGHQSLQEREESFLARDHNINCGFVKGPKESQSTGFELTEDDSNYISRCHIAVISCIFGNSDHLRMPVDKKVTRLSRKNVCFVMFMDEVTLDTLSSEGYTPDKMGFIGLWKIVIVKNLPYTDMRRVGKIPKLLPHRLFPSARYSIWLDSKLRLQVDPLLILEYLLWRKGYEYAISNHYDRHCVWEEVAQNKKLNKYNHTVIDQQFMFYQADGLKRFKVSDPNKLLPSNVPEGSLIVRAHTPMSNLFSCLWFNEVDRFTPRDQLSFAYTYQKLRRMNPGKPFRLHMFKDCERRTIAKLFRHRSEGKQNIHQQETE